VLLRYVASVPLSGTILLQDSTVKDLYTKVAEYAGEDENNFMLMLNGKPDINF